MSSLFDDTPESLVQLRTTVRDWVEKSREAVLSFQRDERDDGSFWRDTKQYTDQQRDPDESLSPTVTARSYTALVAADRCLGGISNGGDDDWKIWFAKFVEVERFGTKDNANEIKDINSLTDLNEPLNRFEVAHLADFVLAADYINRFFPHEKELPELKLLKGIDESKFKSELAKVLLKAFEDCKEKERDIAEEGEFLFDTDESESRHYFVTLHALRALSILDAEHRLDPEYFDHLSNHAQQFCVEQCFYTHRRIRHRQDATRLAFAGVIYCLYARSVDKQLCMAIIESLAEAQQENGRWMSTHPINRPGKGPWHIASPEIALCLTWLYFQPRIPDAARVLLIDMMEKYFTRWVVPTFVRVTKSPSKGKEKEKEKEKMFGGWYGDHTVEQDSVIGWATAVICHFLANYHAVLDDHINRRVIETLGLQASSGKYLIDETAHEKSPRWTKPVPEEDALDSKKRPDRATWPDIRPFAWQEKKTKEELADNIQWNWTDPSECGSLSRNLASKILLPVLESPDGRPKKTSCAGILPGVPGTRKTTLVRTLAEVIEWPLVIVSASVIFEKGFDMMEARANEVFRRLNYLTGCVIFFDEFEEFFRDRRNLIKFSTEGVDLVVSA